jgi:hypothetical protein
MHMRSFFVTAVAAWLCVAAPASAQIITTIAPATVGLGSEGPTVAFHIMGGYANWKLAFIDDQRAQEAAVQGTVTGGQTGFTGAADMSIGLPNRVTIGAGGWYTKLQDLVTTERTFIDTQSITVSSVYANVFVNHIGVQAGVVPFKSGETITGLLSSVDDNQTDLDAFLVARAGGGSNARGRRWNAAIGAGVYRYGASDRGATNPAFRSPSAFAPTGFVSGSLPLFSDLTLDASFWYSAKDKNYDPTTGIGNASQRRITIGIGIQP